MTPDPADPAPRDDPAATHRARLDGWRATSRRLERRGAIVANLRLAVFLAGVALAAGAVSAARLSAAWLLLPAAGFVALVVVHARDAARGERAARAARFHGEALARLEERWAGTGRAGVRFADERHPYALDLDLFGRGSLFERLDTARTPAGEAALARRLLGPADAQQIRARQRAVRELAPRVELRERLAVLGERVAETVDPEALRAWAEAPGAGLPPWLRPAAVVASIATTTALAAWPFAGAGPWPFVVAAAVHAALLRAFRPRVRSVIEGVERIESELPLTAAVLEAMEREPFEAPGLVALQERLRGPDAPASTALARLAGRIELVGQRRNQYFAPIGALLSWGTQLAISIEGWRARHGPRLRGWLDALGELEASCALGAWAYEAPDAAFPEIVEGGARFEARGLGHPLLPRGREVTNDVMLAANGTRLLLVSGSNMSGKSTLLRSVGTAAVLAFAGAPVRAASLRIAPMAIGSVIDVHDSLEAGTSRFMAEIVRLRAILDRARPGRPLLFLLDELFGGTNSHDRRAGAEAVLAALVGREAIGLVTTHDLALTRIAERLDARAANVHFEDRLVDGALAFDYRLRDGVVTRSNALDLMRSIGIDV